LPALKKIHEPTEKKDTDNHIEKKLQAVADDILPCVVPQEGQYRRDNRRKNNHGDQVTFKHGNFL
jgi:hypothetical protein